MNCLRFGRLLNSDFGLKYLFFVGTRSRFYLMKIMTHSSRRSYVINLIILIALSVVCFSVFPPEHSADFSFEVSWVSC